MFRNIDLRSDTVTKPNEAMRNAMYRAEVGDDVYGDDPTVNRLETLAARMLGKEAALFVSSGTQGNLIALLTHCQRGEEIILEANSHIYLYEVGGLAALGGLMTRRIHGVNGYMDPDEIEANIRGENIHYPRTSLICVENTHNLSGGTVINLEQQQNIRKIADKHNLKMHLDGARMFNAAVALNCTPKELVKPYDSIQFCLSKGLGAPIGSLLVGSHDYIEQARKYRKMVGGGMRQVGVIAAPGIVALETMVDRLAKDHANAKSIAESLADIEQISIDLNTVQTNIIVFEIDKSNLTAAEFATKLRENGVLANAMGPYKMRLVTHVDVSREDCLKAVDIIKAILKE